MCGTGTEALPTPAHLPHMSTPAQPRRRDGRFGHTTRVEAAVRLTGASPHGPTDTLLGAEPPLVEHDGVFHVGTFEVADKQDWSYEGLGLSVSVDPDDWAHIARLPGPAWCVTRPDGGPLRFVSWHDLPDHARDRVRAWGADQGWLTQETRFRLTYFDDEADCVVWSDFSTRDEAADEAEAMDLDPDDPANSLTETLVWRPTAAFPDSRVDPEDDPTDVLLAHHVRLERPDLDGVWWNDTYAPESLSCPRGVLVHDLASYQRRLA